MAASAGDGGATRVTRSFAFIDLCGFTDYVDAYGDASGVRELRDLRSAVREIAPMFGVRVDKWLGDGVMLVSVEATPIVAAVLAITQRCDSRMRLDVRAGIATGDVIILEGDDYVGRSVNLASRLCDLAAHCQVLAAADRLELPEGTEAEPVGELTIKGFAVPVPVVAVHARGWDRHTTLRSIVDGVMRPVRDLRRHPAD
jgi:class 3 adenylate cyclase